MPLDLDQTDFAAQLPASLVYIVQTRGGLLGAIDAIERARLNTGGRGWLAGQAADFEGYLLSRSFGLTKDPQQRILARACLEPRVAAHGRVGQVWAAAAMMRYLDWADLGPVRDDRAITTAMAAAARATLLDPTGSDGHEALGSILTALGRTDEGGAAPQKAAPLNPANPEITVEFGWLDALRGDRDQAVERIDNVLAGFTVVPEWYRIPLALDALRRGQAGPLAAEAEMIVAAGDPRELIFSLAAATMQGGDTGAAAAVAALNALAWTPADTAASIAAIFPDPALRARLREAAGIAVDLPPGRPLFITRVLGVDSCRFRVGQARRARSPSDCSSARRASVGVLFPSDECGLTWL